MTMKDSELGMIHRESELETTEVFVEGGREVEHKQTEMSKTSRETTQSRRNLIQD